MLNGLSRGLATWLLILVCGGCEQIIERVKPERVSAGIVARQLRGSNLGFKVDTVMPVWEVRAKKKLAENLDAYVKGQFNKGAVGAGHPIADGEGKGHFESAGVGLDYFPFKTRALGLEAGMEMYYADYEMRGGLGPIQAATPDSFWGGGGNLGLVGEIPLDKKQRCSLVWGVGHNFTATEAKEARVNMSGWYGGLSLQFSWGQ